MNGDSSIQFHGTPLMESLLPPPIPWAWILAACLGIIAIAIPLGIHRARRKTPTLPNRHTAYHDALAQLEKAASLDAREAATCACLAIRRYLCAVARDPSLFETHEEFLARHPSLSDWPATTVETLVATLQHLAAIKYRPYEDRSEDLYDPVSLLNQSRELLRTLDQETAA
jgi:hypothetical protein